MNFHSSDYYEVLGVERGADERDVKRAYFRLVRKYSPESHPEEFKRIRAAYEVLSNVVSRKDYDGLTQWGDEINVRMKAGQTAMERGDYKSAQAEFKHVLVLQPQLAFARDLLGMAYLNGGQPREALAQFELVIAAQPNNAVYHLHKGYAHYAQRQYQQATVAYQRALEIDSADTRVRIALADCYMDTEQFDQALVELDKAIDQDGEVNFQDFVFLMRKVQVQLLRNRPDLADAQVDQIFQILPPDGESRKYVATRIGALAAQLFRMRRSADANRMLARARQLDKRKSLDFQFPAKSTLPIRELPAASQTVLAAMKKNWTPTRIVQRALTGPVLLLLSAISVGLVALYSTTASESLWEGGTKGFMLALVVAVPVLGTLAIRRLRRVGSSPFGCFTEVHPLYLLQVDIEEVTLWPLVNLWDVALTHHLQNGAYQSTTVRMDFGGVPLHLSIRGQQAAVDWAQNLLDTRQRTLSLLADGLLDSEEGLDLVPPELLLGVKAKKDEAARKRTLLTYAGAAAGGVLLFYGGALPVNVANADHDAWAHAAGYGASVSGYRDYLTQFPSGRHADDARTALRSLYDDARASFDKPNRSEGMAAMARAIDALRDKEATEARVAFHGHAADLAPAQEALSAEGRNRAQGAFLATFKQVLGEHVPLSVISPEELPTGKSPVAFDLAYVLTPSARDSLGLRTASLTADFDFSIAVDGGPAWHFKRTVTPAPTDLVEGSLRYTTDTAAYSQLVDEAFADFGRQLGEELGIGWSGAGARPAYEFFGKSAEEQRRTQELLRKIIEQSRRHPGTYDADEDE